MKDRPIMRFTGKVRYPTLFRGEWPAPLYRLWKKVFCKRGFHLFDEVASLDEHYLYCDACGLMVGIEYIEEEDNGSA